MLTRAEKIELLALLEERERRQRTNAIRQYFPDTGTLRREFYPKHTEFMALGATRRERLFLAANRVGKTLVGAYELTLHLTGEYPPWWAGRRFDRPIKAWAAGDTSKTVRDIVQAVLLGETRPYGTGMIPERCIVSTSARSGIADAVDTVHVRHVSGGTSVLTLKSYDQRRESFQGTAMDAIWLDEECPEDIYTECLLRTMTNDGMLLLTFTPLSGLTDVVLKFLQEGAINRPVVSETKAVINATWDDAPHLTGKVKAELMAALPPHQRDARSKGVPQLGSGAIYPVPESEIVVDDFAIPSYWPRGYGLDVGWNFTAAGFWARNPESGVSYLYRALKVSEMRPSEVVKLLHTSDGRIKGVIDPAARGRSQADGEQLLQTYRDLGANVVPANNAVEAGIYEVWQRLVSGRIKIFKGAGAPMLSEYRMYRRDEQGKIVKVNDHLMDGGLRYPVMSFMVDGLAMSTPANRLSDEDAAMWGAVGSRESRRGSPVGMGV